MYHTTGSLGSTVFGIAVVGNATGATISGNTIGGAAADAAVSVCADFRLPAR
ncbi:hypothetical protein Q5H93_22200 [Hymenobacter sp. ASUV-10]|uniref:Right handed beta helix domain-containing protein n=1 Tax=Hymenobacter aranciens TaxID=3063996 RepID=A0ABT9BKD3_9BACT|nr:hypothetical protein [Hymenobacter sp. ASUV-10]MDO7877467.1 hypothetical protein [Hymenobacter sp. ASUV-10]